VGLMNIAFFQANGLEDNGLAMPQTSDANNLFYHTASVAMQNPKN